MQLRKGKFKYYRRVPTGIAHLDRRPFVKISLKTDSEAIARKRVVLVNQATEKYWHNLALHDQGGVRERYDSAVRMARSFGFPYRPVNNLATSDLGDLVAWAKSGMSQYQHPAGGPALGTKPPAH